MSKKNLLLISAAVLLVLSFIILTFTRQDLSSADPVEEYKTQKVVFNNTEYSLLVADTNTKRIQGLSDRTELPAGIDGMLFTFPTADKHGIWMKDMFIDLDIYWLDKNWQVVHIEPAVSPNTFPKVFTPPAPALYVVEIVVKK